MGRFASRREIAGLSNYLELTETQAKGKRDYAGLCQLGIIVPFLASNWLRQLLLSLGQPRVGRSEPDRVTNRHNAKPPYRDTRCNFSRFILFYFILSIFSRWRGLFRLEARARTRVVFWSEPSGEISDGMTGGVWKPAGQKEDLSCARGFGNQRHK